ncbi:MAG TPA: DNA repair exonuclease [Planctomycetota bacterium]|nr:DNA repair exonuclease [Planctomycetota bacterium]
MAFRFLHIGDLHLETAFGGAEATRRRLRDATREALRRAVDCCIEEEVHALLIAGDAFDDEKLSLGAADYFLQQLDRLVDRGIHVFYVTGNHDPGNKGGRAEEMRFLEAPERVGPEAGLWIFRRGTPRATTLLDAAGEPVAVVLGAGHSKANVSTNLASRFQRPETHLPVVGLLHTQVEAAQVSDAHDRYAPSQRSDYEAAGLEYWALGHVHLRQQVFDDLPVWYCGNLQGRHPKETGPKGGLLVEVHAGEAPTVRFQPLAPVEWHTHPVNQLQAVLSRDGLLSLLQNALQALETQTGLAPQDLCVRLVPSGPCPFAGLLLRTEERNALALELQEAGGYLEIQIRAEQVFAPRDLSDLEATPSVQREALDWIRRLQDDDAALLQLAPSELPGADSSVEATTQARLAYLRDRLQGLEEELLTRCFDPEAWA